MWLAAGNLWEITLILLEKMFTSLEGFLYQCNASSQRNNLIKLTHYDGTKKGAHDSQIVRAKENLKLTYGWPRQRQASGINQQIKS